MPTDDDLRMRELALRERQVAVDERRLHAEGRTTFLDWIKGLALPIASLVASVAVFLLQAQQQNFERTLDSVREGYKTYFDRVSKIQFRSYDDYYNAKNALEMTTRIYPEVFCGARDDLVSRIANAPMAVDRAPLVEEINELPMPDTAVGVVQPTFLRLAWLEPHLPSCARTAKAGPAAPLATADGGESARPAATAAGSAAPPSAAAPSAETRGLAPAAAAPAMVASRNYRVFVQVGPSRDVARIDDMRAAGDAAGFRFVAGVEKIARPFRAAQVRYFGPAQAADAEMLAKFMTAQFAGEGLEFTARPIGRIFQNLPQDTMEVWIPDQGAAAAAPEGRSVRESQPRRVLGDAQQRRSTAPQP
jgi:hypothetical protein